jgi:hypothetical protein
MSASIGAPIGAPIKNMLNKKNKPKGFIAIISLMIISSISLILAMSMLKRGVDNASLSLSGIYYENARINAAVCFEDAMLRIKKENKFSRNLNYEITDEDSCSTVITWGASEQISTGVVKTPAVLETTGVSDSFTRTFRYGLEIVKHNVNHSSGPLSYINIINVMSIQEQTQ